MTDATVAREWGIIKVSDLWDLVNDTRLPVTFDISEFDAMLKEDWWGTGDPMTLGEFIEHAKRVVTCEPYPIIITEDKDILDGLHRLADASIKGCKTMQAYIISKEEINKLKQNMI